MAISNEFAQAVNNKNILRIRIMLKDSLLVDKSFSLFDEMQEYAIRQGASPWIESEDHMVVQTGPWSEDDMNYELTALINDFTKEHVNYVKTIISSLYGPPSEYKKINKPIESVAVINKKSVSPKKDDFHEKILKGALQINRVLKKIKEESGYTIWQYKDIDRIKRNAEKILNACKDMEERK